LQGSIITGFGVAGYSSWKKQVFFFL